MQERPNSPQDDKEKYYYEKKWNNNGYVGRNYNPYYHDKKDKDGYNDTGNNYHHRKNYY
jgi:hypothetical protein